MKILFLDDNKDRHAIFRSNAIGCSVDQVYTAAEAIERLDDESVTYDIIFLDHDLNYETENELNDDEEDGRTVAGHLSTIDRYKDTYVFIHSLNGNGAMEMQQILRSNSFSNTFVAPWGWKRFNRDENGNYSMKPLF